MSQLDPDTRFSTEIFVSVSQMTKSDTKEYYNLLDNSYYMQNEGEKGKRG